jgi:hypothetical protein
LATGFVEVCTTCGELDTGFGAGPSSIIMSVCVLCSHTPVLCFLGVGALATGHGRFSTVDDIVSLTCDLFDDYLNAASKNKIMYHSWNLNALASNIYIFFWGRDIILDNHKAYVCNPDDGSAPRDFCT